MIIAVDFDGTCVTHDFPRIGKDIGAIPVLKDLVRNGHQIILFTMRSNKESGDVPEEDGYISPNFGPRLDEAVQWFENNGIPLYGINENPSQKDWTDSPKPYAHLYIDDAALGIPLGYNLLISERPFVDWVGVRRLLRSKRLI